MRARGLLAWLTIWSVGFGVCESAVVVYLRRILYPGQLPDGPLFPVGQMDAALLATERAREIGTIVVMLGVAMLAERRPMRRFAAFAFVFGAWDLAYYAALRVLLGWPASLMDWDLLFLVPASWSAPVLAPVLVSLAFVGAAALLLARGEDAPSPLRPRDWLVLSGGGALILASFFWNTAAVERGELPAEFPWWLFALGWLGGIAWFLRCLGRRPGVA